MKSAPEPNTTYLYLIRHGATSSNEQRPYVLQGKGVNHGLSETGKKQAAAVANSLKEFSIDHVFSSQLERAMETARAIAEPHGHEISTFEDLEECDVGDWETMDWDSIMEQYPEEYRKFIENPAENPYVGGESYADVLNRVKPRLQSLLEQHVGQTIAVVAHNVVNRVYLSELLGIELRKAKDIRQTNTGVNFIRYKDGETDLMTLNSVFHLDRLLG